MNILLLIIGAGNFFASGGLLGANLALGLPKTWWFWFLLISNILVGAWVISMGAGCDSPFGGQPTAWVFG